MSVTAHLMSPSWTVGGNWPNQGEIDIVEGVHNTPRNQMTLHTGAGCSANGRGNGILNPVAASCQGNNGCGFVESSSDSYANVNRLGGGTWAMEWNANGISIWWWDSLNGRLYLILSCPQVIEADHVPQHPVPPCSPTAPTHPAGAHRR